MAYTKKGKIQLKPYSLSEELFDKILAERPNVKVITNAEEFNKYKFGYERKRTVIYDGFKTAIILECVLNEYFPLKNTEITHWKQCIIHKDITQKTPCEKDTDGSHATNYIRQLICNYYSREEYDKLLKEHSVDYDDDLKQYHFSVYEESGVIIKYDNCYKWDINGAHTDALCEIFPKAKKAIRKLHDERKINPINKKYVNYYVGTLASTGYRGTYNWIVQRTTQNLLNGINAVGGDLIYANTDGFMVRNPENLLPHSTELGEFKLEYQGTSWFYYDKNYSCFQLETGEIKGSCLCSVRKHIDLPRGQVVHYDRKKIYENVVIAENITEEVLTNGRDTSLW